MPLDPSIILSGKPVEPPPNPLDQYGRVLALKNALTQGQVQQQQLQEGQVGLQQKQLLFADQQKISKILADPAVGGDIQKAIPLLGTAGVSGQSILALTKAHAENQKTYAETAKANADAQEATQKATSAQQELLGNALQHVKDQGYTPDSFLAASNLIQSINPSVAPKLDQFRAQVAQSQNPQQAIQQIVDSALAASGVGEKVKAARSLAAEQAASTSQKQAEAKGQTLKNDLVSAALQGGAGAGEQLIQQRFAANPTAGAKALAAWRQNLSSGDLKSANEEVNRIYEQEIGGAAKIKAETPAKLEQERQMIPVKAAAAGAEENARIPGRISGAVQEQQALAKLSPDAFAAIPNPTARTQAQNETDKVYKEYTDKVGQTQSFLDSVNAARTNPAIAATIPMQEVRQFINRVNAQELRSVSSGVGGVLQRADTWLEKNTTGVPPKWLLDDIAQIGGIQIQAAKRGFDSGKQRLQMRGVDVTKLPEPNTGTPAGPKVGDTKTFPNGKVGKWDGKGWLAQ